MQIADLIKLYAVIRRLKRAGARVPRELTERRLQKNADLLFRDWMAEVRAWSDLEARGGAGKAIIDVSIDKLLWGSISDRRSITRFPVGELDGVVNIKEENHRLGFSRDPAKDVVFFSQIDPLLDEDHPKMPGATADELWQCANGANGWDVAHADKHINGAYILACSNGAHRYTLALRKMLRGDSDHTELVAMRERSASDWLLKLFDSSKIFVVEVDRPSSDGKGEIVRRSDRTKGLMVWLFPREGYDTIVLAWKPGMFTSAAEEALRQIGYDLRQILGNL